MMTCSSRSDGYIYQLIKKLETPIPKAKYTKVLTSIEPCSENPIELSNLGVTDLVSILIQVECGEIELSLDSINYFPIRVFFLDSGKYDCSSEDQVIDIESTSIETLYLRNRKKERSSVIITAIGT